jgi:FlaA1/EpsC-like NDP-sugar epimerase
MVAAGALTLAYLARFEFDVGVVLTFGFAQALVLLIVIRLGVNYLSRLGISRWRYVGTRDVVRLLAATTVGSLVFLSLTWSIEELHSVPRSVVLLEWVFSGYATGGVWVLYRLAFEAYRVRQGGVRVRVLVVGAGEAAQMLVGQMLRSGAGYLPVALVDDDSFKWGTRVHGVEVVGPTAELRVISESVAAAEIVVGIPSASRDQLRQVIEHCEAAGLPVKILPGMDEVLDGHAVLSQLREVQVEDLLGRDPVHLELPELEEDLKGRTVLVTGAAGSIGSELARQIAINGPRCLVLYDQAETPLYYLDLELRTLAPDLHVVPLVASVTDEDAISRALERYGPDRVFHAAAYKHVPMMEDNRRSAVLTNVLGTYLVARLSAEAGVASFLLVSTDKAIRPSSVMGATKQLAERVVLHLQEKYPNTSFGAVRFGNVLGSNGSVIPLFHKQMERGEPLTVTSEEVTRYFMTIPEAVQLILQASLLESFPGRVAMLDMGNPIRILDLARDLLRLSGKPFRLGDNVVITGLRPGEKLHEELSDPDETVHPTAKDRVFQLTTPPGYDELSLALVSALADADPVRLLNVLISEFPDVAGRRTGPRSPESGVRHAGTHP